MSLINRSFSHIYVERRSEGYDLTSKILERFPDSQKINIAHYKDVFNRPGQSFPVQKKSRKLILAVKEPPYLYKGSDFCYHDPNSDFYYTTPALNCVYDCDYCFLQGMYVSANLVIFVNTGDFLKEASELVRDNPAHLSVSYETDLPAIANIAPLCAVWIEWAAAQNHASMEIRTKSVNTGYLKHLTPNPQTVLAWTLSPQTVIDRYEHRTPPLIQRIEAVKRAIQLGWDVRLCWDPVIFFPGWEDAYSESVKTVHRSVPQEAVSDAHIGVFRMNTRYLKNIQRLRMDTDALYQVFERRGESVTYPAEVREKLTGRMISALGEFLPSEKIRVIG